MSEIETTEEQAPEVLEQASDAPEAVEVVEESTEAPVAEQPAPREPVYIDRPIQTVGRRKEAVVRVRLVPGTGKILKQTGPSTSEEIAAELNMPSFMAFGPDGNLYISLPGIGANDGQGIILMTDLAPGSTPIAEPPVCAAATPALESTPVPEASPFTN